MRPVSKASGLHLDALMIVCLFIQLGLDGIEKRAIENLGLFAFEDLTPEADLPDIEAITKQVGERPTRERDASRLSSACEPSLGSLACADRPLACLGCPGADSCRRCFGPVRPQPH